MTTLNFELHEKQKEIFTSDARFKVVAAGRRGGKTFLSAIELLINGLKVEENGFDLSNKEVWYVAPTFQQGKDVMWQLLSKQKLRHAVVDMFLPDRLKFLLPWSVNFIQRPCNSI